MTLVLDASVTIAALVREDRTPKAQEIMAAAAGGPIWVPSLWRLEVANVLRNLVRRGRATPAFVEASLIDLADMPVSVDASTHDHAWAGTWTLSRDQDLTVYDAAYLELALRLGATLATLDDELANAARRLGLPVAPE